MLSKMFMKIGLPKVRGLLVMTMASISPSGREVPSEGKSAPVQVPPRDGNTSSQKSSPYIFMLKREYIPEDGREKWDGWLNTHQAVAGVARPGA